MQLDGKVALVTGASKGIGRAVFLASNQSSYMTGQIFFVDGGWTAQGKIPKEHMDQVLQQHEE